MEAKTLARIGAVVFVAIAMTAAVIDGARKPDAPAAFAGAPVIAASENPLSRELGRCSALGEAGERDPGCLAAWAKNRRRFLGEER